MKHLLICREYPPAPIPPGGIGTYVFHLSRLLAERGETVHVIAQLWKGAIKKVEKRYDGRLIIHRVPVGDWESFLIRNPIPRDHVREVKGLYQSNFPAQCFSWQAGLLTEELIEQEDIDIIEAQEFEAPLYYFQLRRALGLGSKRQPPCIVHLHSPTEFIALHNDWDIHHPPLRTAKRLEDYSIATADALLCPSQYFANQAEAHYGLRAGTVRVIPLPIGDNPVLEREPNTWEEGAICYVGRLERRKGVIEWIDAAVSVARDYPTVQFEFVGTNCLSTAWMSGEEFLERRIPEEIRPRFHFRGKQNRSDLPKFLGRSRIAVVPSRWENFPNTCVEAMCSGLPVIASREGGMVEMIEHGNTGWLANYPGSEGLAEALRTALATPSQKLAEMGTQAAFNIQQMCDNEKIIEAHLTFRQAICEQGAKHSQYLPANLPWAKQSLAELPVRRTPDDPSKKGLAIVITCFNDGQLLDQCLQSLTRQTQKPVTVIIMDNGSTEEQTLKALNQASLEEIPIIQHNHGDFVAAKNAGITAILGQGLNPLGFVFLDAEYQLRPNFVATCESVLQQCPEVGLVSGWAYNLGTDSRIWLKSCPSFPHQWLSNEAAPFSAVRTEALLEAGNFRPTMHPGYEDWDLFNAVMSAGWVAVTVPEILANHRFRQNTTHITKTHTHGRMRQQLLERFPELVTRDAKDIVLLSEADKAWSLREELLMLKQLTTPSGSSRRTPRIALRLYWKVKKKAISMLSKVKKAIA